MRILLRLSRHYHVARLSILLIAIALVLGTAGCDESTTHPSPSPAPLEVLQPPLESGLLSARPDCGLVSSDIR